MQPPHAPPRRAADRVPPVDGHEPDPARPDSAPGPGPSALHFRAVQDLSPDGSVLVESVRDADGRVVDFVYTYVNPAAERLTGRSAAEMLGRRVLELFPHVAAEGLFEAYRRVVETGEPFQTETEYAHDGMNHGLRVTAVRVGDGFHLQFADVTERLRLVAEQRHAERRARFLAALAEALQPLAEPDALMATTARLLGRHLGADRCAYAEVEADEDTFTITGNYTRGDTRTIVGRYTFGAFGAEVRRLMRADRPYVVDDAEADPRVTPADRAAYDQTQIRAVVCVPLHKAGRLVAAMAVHQRAPRRWTPDEVELVVTVVQRCWESLERARAVRALRAREAALQEMAALLAERTAAAEAARRAAEAADKAKSEFLATMSHELRTPLNAIGGYAQLLEFGLRGPVSPEQAADLGRIQANQRRLLALVDDILTFTRIGAGRLPLHVADVPLADALALVHASVEPQLKRNRIAYVFRGCPPEVAVRADRDRLQQVVINLLSNAAKFTPPGGRVTLHCGAARRPDGARVGWATVRDTGPGIPADKQAAVFEPFVQASDGLTRAAEGSGLGLAISRELVRAMGGDVTLRSREGEGAAFTVTLPLSDGVPAEALDEWRRATDRVPLGAGEAGGAAGGAGRPAADGARGLTVEDVTDAVTLGAQALARRYAARLRTDPDLPYAHRASDAELEDHVPTYLATVAKTVRAMTRAAAASGVDAPAPLPPDDAEVLRLIAERHGAQRFALGWPREAVPRDGAHLRAVVAAALAPGAAGDDGDARRARDLFLDVLDRTDAYSAAGFAAAERESLAARGGAAAAPRVLLAEDDELERFVYASLLRHAGYAVDEAATGDDAVRQATAAPPDVAVLDIHMPGRDGWEVAEALRAAPATRDVPCVALTGTAGPDEPGGAGRARAEGLGFAAYLVKPVRPQAVLAAVARVVRAARPAGGA